MRVMAFVLASLPLFAPGLAMAAGSDSSDKPAPTETSEDCKSNQVWDGKQCVNSRAPQIDEDMRIKAIRELAYFGRLDDAQTILKSLDDSQSDMALTYWGFTHRKMGNLGLADVFYEAAITQNPDNLLARSYMGQGYVAAGKIDEAVAQWQEIIDRGGEGTWAEASLSAAIRGGPVLDY